jgi:transcriptional regulator with XRE-family HTH domain
MTPTPTLWRQKLKERINEHTTNQSELSRQTGVSRAAIIFYQSGDRTPTVAKLYTLLKVLYPDDFNTQLEFYSHAIFQEEQERENALEG